MLGDVLTSLSEGGALEKCPEENPVVQYFKRKGDVELSVFLETDDMPSGTLSPSSHAKTLEQFQNVQRAGRLINRRLYKCFEIPTQHSLISPFKEMAFRKRLREAKIDFREDDVAAKTIKDYDEGSPSYFLNILIWPEGKEFPVAIGRLNPLISDRALRPIKRLYFPNNGDEKKAEDIWNGLRD